MNRSVRVSANYWNDLNKTTYYFDNVSSTDPSLIDEKEVETIQSLIKISSEILLLISPASCSSEIDCQLFCASSLDRLNTID